MVEGPVGEPEQAEEPRPAPVEDAAAQPAPAAAGDDSAWATRAVGRIAEGIVAGFIVCVAYFLLLSYTTLTPTEEKVSRYLLASAPVWIRMLIRRRARR
jgi:hypothetical protein